MEKVINLLYDIEEKANQIVKRANEEKAKLHEQLQKDMEQLDRDIEAQNAVKLKELKVQADKELAHEKQALINDCIKHLTHMEKNYEDKHSFLADKIFQDIIHS